MIRYERKMFASPLSAWSKEELPEALLKMERLRQAMTPEQIAKAGTEHAHQCALFAAIALAHPLNGPWHPLHLLHAIHNKGHGDAIRGAKAKAEGVKAGVPDLCLPIAISCPNAADQAKGGFAMFHFHGAYVELKIPAHLTHKNYGCSDDQVKWLLMLRQQGYYTNVAFGWEHALGLLGAYVMGSPLKMIEFSQ